MKSLVNYVIYLFLFISPLNQIFFDKHNIKNNKPYLDSVYINIPKINLYQPIYSYYSSENNVNKNVYLANNYDFNKFHGSLVLAAHSGGSKVSYFNDLDQINMNDVIIIETNKYNYFYGLSSVYEIDKNGSFYYADDDSILFLITCSKKYKNKQVVFKGILYNIVEKSVF